jgi:hypothetical protein
MSWHISSTLFSSYIIGQQFMTSGIMESIHVRGHAWEMNSFTTTKTGRGQEVLNGGGE